MERIRQEIPQEPTSGAILRIRVVYPDGTKLQRNFMMSDKVGLLLDMVELDMFDHQMDVDAFQLYVTVPALCLDDTKREQTFEELSLKGSCVFRIRVL